MALTTTSPHTFQATALWARGRWSWLAAVSLMWSLGVGGCCRSEGAGRAKAAGTSGGEAYVPVGKGQVLRGDASYYANYFNGRRTASGDRYDPRKLTAANRTLPLGTKLKVTRVDSGRSVVVTVNDRGPFGKRRRILDLSRAAAERLGMISDGHTEVRAEVLD
jgi:rare lipoprotein A